MKASEVAAQRRQLAALKARNRELASRINQLQRSKATTEQRTAALRRKQQQLAQDIQTFETQLERGQLSAAQANSSSSAWSGSTTLSRIYEARSAA